MTSIFLKVIWDADPILIRIGDYELSWYASTYIASLFVHYLLLRYFFRKENKPAHHAMQITELLFITGIIGSRLGQVFFYEWAYYSKNLLEIPQIWKGGLSSHGSAIGVLAGILYYSIKHRWPFLYITDRIAIITLFCAGLIRIGNLFNSEIIGKHTDVSWAFMFTRVDHVWRHPSQLYDVLISWSLFAVFFLLYHRLNGKRTGLITGLFFSISFSLRALIEEYKAEATRTQWLSLPFILFGIGILIYTFKKRNITT